MSAREAAGREVAMPVPVPVIGTVGGNPSRQVSVCPRCASRSLLRNHDTVSCLPCGHVLQEPAYEAWDAVSTIRGGGKHLGPPVTESEALLWKPGAAV